MNHNFIPKREENFQPAFFERPESYEERSEYKEDPLQKEEKNISFDKYYEDTSMSNVEYSNKGLRTAAVRGVQDKDLYSNTYFSKENISYVQKRIRKEIHDKSKFLVGYQDETELVIIMRSFHIQYSRNIPDCSIEAIKSEIKRMDDIVINFCVPRIISEVRQYFHYLNDASKLPVPLEHPKLLSNAGTKSLNPSLSIPFNRNFN